MHITSLISHSGVHFEDIPDDIYLNFVSYLTDLGDYHSLRLTNHRFSTLPLEEHMKHLFTFSSFIQVLKKAKTPPLDKFIAHRIDFTQNAQEAIRVASEQGLDQIVACLLQQPTVNPAVKNHQPLTLACEKGHAKVVQLLLKDKGGKLTITQNAALAALCLASQNGHLEVVNLLLADPRVNYSFLDKKLPSMMAKRNGHSNIVNRLQSN